MDSDSELAHDFSPFFKVYKDGRFERYLDIDDVPDGPDPETGVTSKDVVISATRGLKARIFYPELAVPNQRLPLLVHYHGGGFCLGSAFDLFTKRFLSSIVMQGNVVAISVHYRLALEHPLPVAYEDSWAALKWIEAHAGGHGREKLLSDHVDFGRVFLTGDNAGANIAHYLAIQVGAQELEGVRIPGAIIMHPFFGWGMEDKMFKYLCPTSLGTKDPRLHPTVDPNWPNLGCERVLVCVAERDGMRSRGEVYYKALKASGWAGKTEFYESRGQGHVFYLFLQNEEREALIMKFVEFISQA